jgi:hypothetical protein
LKEVHEHVDQHADRLFVVLVGHGQADMALASMRLSPIVRRYGATLIAVDTSAHLMLEDGAGINDAFEFSGYEYGLKKACAAMRGAHSDPQGEDVFRVVVLNSTVFTAHISLITSTFFRFLSSKPGPGAERPTVVGLRWEARAPISDVADLGWYFATNLFCMIGPVSKLDSFCFYDRRQVARFQDAVFDMVSDAYGRAVIDWLTSRSILGGWYKSNPFAALPPSELVRKRITIYLEHSLPRRLNIAGFDFVAANGDSGRKFRLLFKLLIIIDRFYVNLLKLGFRSRLFLLRLFGK